MNLSLKSPAKVNFTLDVLRKDEVSGYHFIQTVFQRVDIFDEMEFSVLPDGGLVFRSNRKLPEDNTITKAYHVFCKHVGRALPVSIKLKKAIPIGAGLGGASGDAATTIIALNHIFSFHFETDLLSELGREVGMDVPFFISNYSTALGTHFGDKIVPLPPFPRFEFLVIYPKIKVETKKAYEALDLSQASRRMHQTEMLIDKLRRHTLDARGLIPLFHNDFEGTVFSAFPRLKALYEELATMGLEKVMLTGSGSSLLVFGSSARMNEVKAKLSGKCQMYLCHTY